MRVGQALGVNFKRATPTPAFTMPSGMRIRYDRPSDRLQPYVTGYAIYINEHRAPMSNWFLPSPAMITVLLDAGRVTASIRNRTYDAVPAAALWGPASHAPHTITRGGIMVGVGLTALGWARLTARPADLYANTVSPVSDVIGSENAGDLVAALDGLDTDAGFAPTLNRALPALLQREMPPQHALVEALERMIVSDGVIGVSEVAVDLGVSARDLRRIASRYFGMPSKVLLSRARFVRSYVRWLMMGEPGSYLGIDSSYFDASHFLRDAQTYLGTTPRRFADRHATFLKASLYARSALIGAPAHTLHHQQQSSSNM
jgi:hypothetical protein